MENRITRFEIAEGHFEDHVFVSIGEFQKGQAALKEIFTCRIDVYVKVWDPYIDVNTIKLVSNSARSISILILTQNVTNKNKVIEEACKLPNKIKLRKLSNLHDRFILTMGEGWTVGHSLKDFGTKPSLLTKLASSLEPERAFDENWIQSQTVFEKD